jgi:hypothetical protein
MWTRAYSTILLRACLLFSIVFEVPILGPATAIAAPADVLDESTARALAENGNYITLLPLANLPASTSPHFRYHYGPLQWTIEYPMREFAGGLAGVGDVNGDGFDDLLVSARGVDGKVLNKMGFFFLLLGSRNGLAREPILFRGPATSTYGTRVAAAGDVNGDGLADFFSGAPLVGDSSQEKGKVNGWFGRHDEKWGDPEWGWTGPSILPDAQRFGGTIACAGDVNHDGFDDVLVGSPRFLNTNGSRGVVFLFLGSPSGPASTPAWVMFGSSNTSAFGTALAAAGDVNGDGFADVIIGDPGADEALQERGRAFVFLGSPSGLQSNAIWVAQGPEPGSRFGFSVAGKLDCNKDGCSEIIIGAPGAGGTYPGPGYVALYKGSRQGPEKQPAWTGSGSIPGGKYGYRVASLGDVNGDGFPDVVISAPSAAGTQPGSGFVYFYPGNGNTLSAHPAALIDGGQKDAQFGRSLCAVGDINRDGLADFAIGSPRFGGNKGRVDIFLGSSNAYRLDRAFPADGTNSFFGQDPATAARWRDEKAHAALVLSRHVETALSAAIKQIKTNAPILVTTNITLVRSAPGFVSLPLKLSLGSLLAGSAIALFVWKRRAADHSRLAAVQTESARSDERKRIARDLHDDLGARLTRISVLTELVQRKSGAGQENAKEAQLLAETAQEVLGSMEEILWSVNPANDTLENLVTFILQYAGPFLAPSGIKVLFSAPDVLPHRVLAAQVRKNLFLCLKEALNNVAKHSGATQIQLRIQFHCSSRSNEVVPIPAPGSERKDEEPVTNSHSKPDPSSPSSFKTTVAAFQTPSSVSPAMASGTCVNA